MFWRLLLQLLRGSRGRLAVALLALVSGAAVISALLNLDLDMERKLTQEFRSLGANLVIAPRRTPGIADSAAMSGALMDQSEVLAKVENLRSPEVVAAAPMLYVVVQARGSNVVLAGTWLDQIPKLAPSWKISGEGIRSREDATYCLVGRNVARQLHAAPGSPLELDYLGRSAQLTLAGIVDSGGAEDNQIFVNLPVAQNLAGLNRQIGLVQLSVAGNWKTIEALERKLSQALPGLEVRPIRQVTEAEGSLLNRIRLLIVSMVILILALTALCVLATMAALAMERRSDVGLMKALGGSITRIVGIFLAEVGVLGALGGLLGCFAGVVLSNWMGRRVFGAAISLRWEIFPLTIAMMVGVALAAAFPLRLLGKVKPAVILRGE
ncbi:MAG TPA: ABC transporter permease [Candidatus Limnocylindrales bacterium]|jgi:putative ABC transport system permease protein|nr:ABC transporter permease [Candidatus Limnocylindrales bacterium]